jgi:hypothetical protein
MNYVDALSAKDYVEHCNSNGIVVNAEVMRNGGYFLVTIDPSSFWKEAHDHLIKRYGKNNYVWTGEKFWFNTHEEAMQFYEFYKDWLED